MCYDAPIPARARSLGRRAATIAALTWLLVPPPATAVEATASVHIQSVDMDDEPDHSAVPPIAEIGSEQALQQPQVRRADPSLGAAWRSATPELIPGIRTISRGSSVEVLEPKTGVSLSAGNLAVPTSIDGRPGYIVLDQRPVGFMTAALEREMGVQALYRPLKGVSVTVGGYNNKGSYKSGTLPVKAALTRMDINLGSVRGGGFYYYGTGRWWGDKTKAGFDVRTRLGPFEISAQVMQGTIYGIDQLGWYASISQQLRRSTTLAARFEQFNSNTHYLGPDSHAILALVERLAPTRTFKLNLQVSAADPSRAPTAPWPSNWAVLGQLSQRY